ncbi:MAG: DNA cytosine methyltransferase [Ferrovibrio sp.]|uniref:DNA cytosine methyltransferase n=1 Tax=Ferrovibrio sp. TaxID=1917215 RepID=UPI003919414A
MRSLDLFSGIGGFARGFHAAGIETVAFCDSDPAARCVLQKHWPDIPVYHDVRDITRERLLADGIPRPNIISGGFPCQDISIANPKAVGLDGERSGLWWEFHRIVEEIHPEFVVAENSPQLRSRGLDRLLGSLDALGYDAEWHCIPAAALGAPHRRDRLWIVAYARSAGLATSEREALLSPGWWQERGATSQRCRWPAEPNVGRVAHGLPGRVHRLRLLGNSVVPIIPQLIGEAIRARAAS